MKQEFILFTIEDSTYAVPVSQVRWVDIPERITPVPNAPDFVQGIILARGHAVPVVSVRRCFHLDPVPIDLRARLIVISIDERQVGLLVDTAREFVRLDTNDIQPLPPDLSGPGREYLQGVAGLGKEQSRLALLVDLHKLLNPEEKKALSNAPLSETAANPE